VTATNNRRPNGFSLVELVIVVVIMGIIAAVAIPRLSRGARTAGSSALKSNLSVLRNAVEMYAAEHDGKYPDAGIINQLTQFSNATGATTSATKTATEVYGPYIKEFPPLPVGSKKDATAIHVTTTAADVPPQGLATDGWWYNTVTQTLRANIPDADVDDDTKKYNSY
jgi:prepilin-type N-terminal cleavage/methylation domain-containing protein